MSGAMAAMASPALAAPNMEVAHASLVQAVGAHGLTAGMVAMAIAPDGTTAVTSYGSAGADGVALDGDTVFPIMSITKVMTSLLLAGMVEKGEVAFDDPLTKYLPASAAPPVNGRAITLLDLATYRSGLANMPNNLPANWYLQADPLGSYTEKQLFESLSSTAPRFAPGTHYEYANLAFGILSVALARAVGKGFDALLIERICQPLGLSDTRTTLPERMRRRLAQGHDLNFKPFGSWDAPAMPGMADVCSTAKDLSVFLKACLGFVRSPLEKPLARLVQTRAPTPLAGTDAAMAWFITRDGGEEIVWKTGLSNGHNTFIGYSPTGRRGAVVLSNFLWQPLDTGTIMIGIKMIKPDFPATDFYPLYRPV